MNEASLVSEHSYFGDEQSKIETEQNKTQFDFSKNSSNPEGIFDTLNKEIKLAVENCKDLSYYSNSNSKISEQQQYNEQFLDSRYWCVRKNNNESDSPNTKNEKSGLSFSLGLGFFLGFLVQSVVIGRQQRLHFFLELLVEQHIEVADEVVALLARRLRCAAVAPLQPSQHTLADVDATIVDQVDAHHSLAVGFHDLGDAPAKKVVADMA